MIPKIKIILEDAETGEVLMRNEHSSVEELEEELYKIEKSIEARNEQDYEHVEEARAEEDEAKLSQL